MLILIHALSPLPRPVAVAEHHIEVVLVDMQGLQTLVQTLHPTYRLRETFV
jgi:hypothetical protein